MKCCDWYTSYLFPQVFIEKLWINFTALKIYSQTFNRSYQRNVRLSNIVTKQELNTVTNCTNPSYTDFHQNGEAHTSIWQNRMNLPHQSSNFPKLILWFLCKFLVFLSHTHLLSLGTMHQFKIIWISISCSSSLALYSPIPQQSVCHYPFQLSILDLFDRNLNMVKHNLIKKCETFYY